MADAVFLEGGFHYTITRKILEAMPLLIKTTPIFARCSEKQLVNRPKIRQRLAKVSLSFSSLTRKGGSINFSISLVLLMAIDQAQRGSLEPQEPP